jgi:2-polyprenyl-6-methoxyphenol hydroxylase-like FAD-dependent oxidoreductase
VLHPQERGLHYTGYMMWRGLHRQPRLLDGRSMVRAGWIEQGKMVIYPIRDYDDGTQLVNWVAEVESPQLADRDWSSVGALTDFVDTFAEWTFDWLDVPAMMRATESVLQYPMVDQEPLPFWTRGRVTLLGDAAHPMVPRGSNGAGQAILDTRALTDALVAEASVETALKRYEVERLEATARVVLLNRDNPPDAILRVVADRTGDRPFDDLDAHVDRRELAAIVDNYRRVTGSSREALAGSEAVQA